jgi:alkylated DNA repair dioxygenase AlkB
VSQLLGQTVSFNAVLLNAYRSGADGMGWHRDNEPELGGQPVIASVSLGAVRRFSIRTYGEKKRWDISLEPGSLLWMYGESQTIFEHSVPKTAKQVEPRINLTFRLVYQSNAKK